LTVIEKLTAVFYVQQQFVA